jgi:hypothetical protein
MPVGAFVSVVSLRRSQVYALFLVVLRAVRDVLQCWNVIDLSYQTLQRNSPARMTINGKPIADIIIDGTTIKAPEYSDLGLRQDVYNAHKKYATYTCLHATAANGVTVWVSDMYDGGFSDMDIFSSTKFGDRLNKLGREYMKKEKRKLVVAVDRGFFDEVFAGVDAGVVEIVRPTYISGAADYRYAPEEVYYNNVVTVNRSAIERTHARMKDFDLLDNKCPWNRVKILGTVVYISLALNNLCNVPVAMHTDDGATATVPLPAAAVAISALCSAAAPAELLTDVVESVIVPPPDAETEATKKKRRASEDKRTKTAEAFAASAATANGVTLVPWAATASHFSGMPVSSDATQRAIKATNRANAMAAGRKAAAKARRGGGGREGSADTNAGDAMDIVAPSNPNDDDGNFFEAFTNDVIGALPPLTDEFMCRYFQRPGVASTDCFTHQRRALQYMKSTNPKVSKSSLKSSWPGRTSGVPKSRSTSANDAARRVAVAAVNGLVYLQLRVKRSFCDTMFRTVRAVFCRGFVRTACSCPVGLSGRCAHAACLLLMVQAIQEGGGALDKLFTPSESLLRLGIGPRVRST